MYNLVFNNTSTSQIADTIKREGYFFFENALTNQYVEDLLQEVDFNQFLINTNDVGMVCSGNQKFLTHCLAKSKKAYDIITSRQILDICKEYFNDGYRLTNHRIYQTSKNLHLPWHTDNNRQANNKITSKHNMPGLQFFFYLSDVTKNPFQYLKNSHHWSREVDEINLSDNLIYRKYKKDIVTFKMKKGSFIVCNTHGFHRAEPFQDRSYTRTTLLFQVDRVGSENLGHGEKNLVNTEYVDNPTQEVLDYLGFGFKTDYQAFPITSVATMTVQDVLALQRQLLPLTLQAVATSVAKAMLPKATIIDVKRMLWRLKRNRSRSKR